ncbi:RNA polymerase, sigma 54 subunit, RpoN/SigL [Rhodovulum sp. ES.010]|uniref:RNA polymerase factor sigma-54 n=1 Tax=Rhodovulum sp. ES.010 TaxID=1882821 RepID=UPI000929BD81|nr:hypothetical protein [Rhodovulum sp. ES.010]SIO48908.1 RNA polymerase, sigma 54 subunit, RpoN/SigL [Rhodovulum sp. ES.010]
MGLRPDLSPRPSQGLRLTPGLRQGLAILRMPATDLAAELRRAADENPLIRLSDPDGAATGAPGTPPTSEIAAPDSLGERLRRQLALMPLAPPVAAVARFLCGDIDEDGYLDEEAAGNLEGMGVAPDEVAAAIEALQACDPPGVGARSLEECLALQMREHGMEESAARAVCARLDLLAERRLDDLGRATGLDGATLAGMARLLPRLTPRPGASAAQDPLPPAPEIIVEEAPDGRVAATLDGRIVPRAEFDTRLARELSGQKQAANLREEAQTLVGALRFRERTLETLAFFIVDHQARFFIEGPEHLVPMTRAEMAEALGLHPSTVGRALADKALSYRGVVHPLSRFVSRPLPSNGAGPVTAYGVQRHIRRLIEAETPCSILSDEEIAAILRREGVDIARRTVAKYRQGLTIPSSFERRKRKAQQV